MNLTEAQRKAIYSTNARILVSASAGSGKTFAMVRRVVKLLKEDRVPLCDILMLTYTDAAAAEMRQRLTDAIVDEVRKATGELREFLRAQLDSVPLFMCGTLHSYCYGLIKCYGERVGLLPTVSVLSDEAAEVLRDKAAQGLFERLYEEEDAEFAFLTEQVGGRDGSDLKAALLALYDNYVVNADRAAWLAEAKKQTTLPLCDTEAAGYMLAWVKSTAEADCKVIKQALEGGIYADDKASTDYLTALYNISFTYSQAASVKDLFKLTSGAFPKKPSATQKYPLRDGICVYGEVVKNLVRDVASICDNGYDEAAKTYAQSVRSVNALLDLLVRYVEEFDRLKSEQNVVDFSDFEKYALLLLKEYGDEICAPYRHVLVDEFQDINPVQYELVSVISRNCSLYMVGDVKQSIYRFRQADPQIFKATEREFLQRASGEVVPFRENFRSSTAVINFVNCIFTKIMTPQFGNVDYTNETLVRGGEYEPTGSVNCMFYIDGVAKEACLGKQEAQSGIYSVKNACVTDADSANQTYEAEWVYRKMQEELGKQYTDAKTGKTFKVGYGDMALLAFKRAGANRIIEYLRNKGVPLTTGDFCKAEKTYDMDVLANFVRLLHNPHNDYALISVLSSCLFGFSADELALVAAQCEGSTFYEKAYAASQSGQNAKLYEAVKYIDDMRFMATALPVGEVVRRVVAERYGGVANAADGGERLGTLNLFVNRIVSKGSISLGEFLDYYDNFYEGESVTSTEADAVKVLTVHKSKGLEFPVVFVVGAGVSVTKAAGGSFAIDAKCGVAGKCYDEATHLVQNGFAFNAISHKARDEQLEDGLRLLYVALTRAQNSLFVCGSISAASAKNPPHYSIAKKFSEWVLYGAKETGCYELNPVLAPGEAAEAPAFNVQTAAAECGGIAEAFSYTYPHKKSTETGIKFTVTAINSSEEDGFMPPTPLFGEEKRAKGTSIHKVMEKIALGVADAAQVRETLQNLVAQGELTQDEAAEIRVDTVLDAVRKLGALSEGASKVMREQNFMLWVDAASVGVGDAEEKVLVQGKIDFICIGRQNVIVDYKLSNLSPETLREKYRKQLDLYAYAAQQSLGVRIDKKYIFALGRNILIEI